MPHRVLVIGGGIVGLSCAFFARREGFNVVVVDPDVEDERASYGNAGVLALCEQLPLATPKLMSEIPKMLVSRDSALTVRWNYVPTLVPWMIRFALASFPANLRRATQSLHAILSEALQAHQTISTAADAVDLLTQTGWIKAWYKAPRSPVDQEQNTLASLGVAMRDLSANELSDLAPAFAGVFTAATLYTDCYHVSRPATYVNRIAKACANMGVVFVRGKADSFEIENGTVRAVHLEGNGQTFGADNFIIAGGAWSKNLAAQLGDRIPLDTERGYHLMLGLGDQPALRAPLLWQDKSIVFSQMGDNLRMTSSVEFAGLLAPPRFENIERALASIRHVAPALADMPVRSRWQGFRPSLPDSVPVIGRSARHNNCFLAFGHGHLGLTLGPITGQLIVDLIAGRVAGIDMAGFSPARFA